MPASSRRAALRRGAASAGTRWLVLDASAVSQIDSTAVDMLAELADELRERGIKLGLAELHHEARKLLERGGVVERIGTDMVFDITADAYRAFEARG